MAVFIHKDRFYFFLIPMENRYFVLTPYFIRKDIFKQSRQWYTNKIAKHKRQRQILNCTVYTAFREVKGDEMGTVFSVSKISKQYGQQTVLKDVSFSLKEREILGLTGGNGAGKTTLIRLITGVNQPDSGEIDIAGKTEDRYRKIGTLIERPAIYKDMSAIDNLRYYGKLLGLEDEKKKADAEETYKALLEKAGLSGCGKKKAGRFSTGMKQRLGIAIALLGDVTCLILDEPFNGLDAAGISELRSLLLRLKEESVSILITSHQISELTQICDRYVILDQGRIVFEATHEELREQAGGDEKIESLIVKKLGGE